MLAAACRCTLAEHFDAAELSVYGNKWAEVYDFTASSGGNFKIMSLVRRFRAARCARKWKGTNNQFTLSDVTGPVCRKRKQLPLAC